jgi:hypothetical protein
MLNVSTMRQVIRQFRFRFQTSINIVECHQQATRHQQSKMAPWLPKNQKNWNGCEKGSFVFNFKTSI